MVKCILLSWACLVTNVLLAQFQYDVNQSIPVQAQDALSFPWAGGFNGAQVNTVDLNGDNQNDLVIYDKSVDKFSTFLRASNQWQYAPEFERLLPADVSAFVLLRDYNCDGKKDLFTFNTTVNGISVYRNTSAPGENISFSKVRIFIANTQTYTDILLSKGFTSLVNILPGVEDVPNITDMDGDGDLDILNMRFVNPSTAEYHQNFSMERYGKCDSLVFERQTQRWGDWQECSCGVFAFGTTCPPGGRTQHTGGKSLLALDVDNDGDQDVLFSEEQCSRIYLLTNQGNKDNPVFTGAQIFPSSNPVNLASFPVPSLEDVTFDNVPDLLASPNLNARVVFSNNFQQSLWIYNNAGTAQLPSFTFNRRNFLQDEMIDIGDNSVPAFADADNDGDLDMFIGTYTSGEFYGRIWHFQNVGTPTLPSFQLASDNWVLNDLLPFFNVKPQFADMDADGKLDLVFTATQFNTGASGLYYIPNRGSDAMQFSTANLVAIEVALAATENVLVVDVNSDGALDLLIGRADGSLEYRRNTGSPGSVTSYALISTNFLGFGSSVSRQNLALAVADLDADGNEDLVAGDQRGTLAIFSNFRQAGANPTPERDVIFDPLSETFYAKPLGGRIWPSFANLFNTSKPAIVVGNAAGGLYVLTNRITSELPPDPVITIFPNPVPLSESMKVKADRPVSMEVYSLLGQQLSTSLPIPANQEYPVELRNLSSGIYIARFSAGGKTYSQRFVVLR